MCNILTPASKQQQTQKEEKSPSPSALNQIHPNTDRPGYPAVNQFNSYPAHPVTLEVDPYAYPDQQVLYVQHDPQNRLRGGGNPFEGGNPFNQDFGNVDQQFHQGAFTDSAVRRVFIRKVYLILTIQMIFTIAVISLFVFEPRVNKFVLSHKFLFWIYFAIFIVVYLILACIIPIRRSYPWNVIGLAVLTVAASYVFGYVSCTYKTETVLIAVGVCALSCFLVTLFSFYTKFDFTGCGGMLCIISIAMLVLGIVAIILQHKLLIFIYGGLGALMLMMFLAYDTQMIMGGKSEEISLEDHVLAVICLYTDILYLYHFLLVFLGNTPE